MAKTPWTPWHQVVTLRDDVRSGELALNEFAADLYEVSTQSGRRRLYEDPAQFFALTYPTLPLRDLVRDVVQRLAGLNQKAVRQLELTYGGGKTHTLIALFHLANDPTRLPDLPTIGEFRAHAGIDFPAARVAVLPFDKIDAEKGIEVRDPAGNRRMLRQPWSALAWQLAGGDGLRVLHADGKDEERRTPPAENLLVELLAISQKEGKATLVLLDEVLMFAHAAVDADPAWHERLKNFFQYLTQAATKVDRCCVVASLLATDVRLNDRRGKEITDDLYAIFRREREQAVEPVGKKDVAEVLRRRFFTPESIADKNRFGKHVIDALAGIESLDEQTRKGRKEAEDRFRDSYPFHPDLTEVLYAKWTQLEGFQRTRGVLRTFALALRDAEKWDDSPLVGAGALLNAPGQSEISEAARELTQVASVEEHEGKRQEWTSILAGELEKAARIEQEFAGIKHREIEQAVIATFLHSQPPGQRAQLRDLLLLIASTRPDKIELLQGLRAWFESSWFLDESADADVKADGGVKPPPSVWRLGSRPNLRQMQADAKTRISDEVADDRLLDAIRKHKPLTQGASQAGARVHNLPERPAMVDDDGEFRYVVLGPSAASESGKPSAEARRFIEEHASAEDARKERNAIVIAVPSKDGVAGARNAVREHLAWQAVDEQLKKDGHELDLIRRQTLDGYLGSSSTRIADAIRQAYCIVVTVSTDNDIQAFKIQPAETALFSAIKDDSRSRIQETAISPDALLPGGPYQLWRENEDSRPVRDLVGGFARFPHLPKMLNRKAILDTVVRGCEEGYFVARVTRPDKSVRTWWRQAPEGEVLDDPQLELVLPEKATLTSLASSLLHPGAIDQLWLTPSITVGSVHAFFDGTHRVTIVRGGYEEAVPVPRAEPSAVDDALRQGVGAGRIWLTSGPASLLGEEVPAGLLSADAAIQAPPEVASPLELLPASLPDAWQDGRANALSIAVALSKRAGKSLPWTSVREAIDQTLRSRVLDQAQGSVPWPSDYAKAGSVTFALPTAGTAARPTVSTTTPADTRVSGQAVLKPNQLQDLVDVLPAVMKAAAGYEVTFTVMISLKGKERPSDETVAALNRAVRELDRELTVP